jgi:hypothetical protein
MSSQALASVVAVVAFLTACGTEAGDDGGSPASSGPVTQLRVEFRAAAGSEPVSVTLSCNPPAGDHPRAAAACATLAHHEDAFRPVPGDVACTEIYGGPEKASVTGTFRGQQVKARFERTDGCEIARWDALDPLLRLRD